MQPSVEHAELARIDWTSVILASIAAWSATYAGWVSRRNSKAIDENSVLLKQNAELAEANTKLVLEQGRQLKTNSDRTINRHVDALQAEMSQIAADKERADARVAAAALIAAAKLALAVQPLPLRDQAEATARRLLKQAEDVADRLDWDRAELHAERVSGELDADVRETAFLMGDVAGGTTRPGADKEDES